MLPNFLIIGAAKAGTTSLYHYLRQHPDVYMSPVKETNFFAFEDCNLRLNGPRDMAAIGRFSITRRLDYERLFNNVTTETAIGEASPQYLYSSRAASKISAQLPHAKLICILRNPIERAYSHFLMFRREHREPEPNFRDALEREDERISSGWEWAWRYKQVGLYAEQLQRYQLAFERGLIRVFLYEDLQANPEKLVADICDFLGISIYNEIDTAERHNPSGIPRSAQLQHLLTQPSAFRTAIRSVIPETITARSRRILLRANLRKPPMSVETRRYLEAFFRADIYKLEKIINRDLSHWIGS